MDRTLHGSCACGRNHYVVEIPPASNQLASILFDNSHTNRHHQASPFTAFLRVPLDWYHSSASPFFPDEPLSQIRRTFHEPGPASPSAGLRRQFCGYCGTPLSSWHERTREDADFISLTLGSLREQDVRALEGMGLLSGDLSSEEGDSEPMSRRASPPAEQERGLHRDLFGPLQVTPSRGAPWFEKLVEDSRLGRIKRTRGGYTSNDGSVREEWDVVEWTTGDDEAEGSSRGKRKFAEEAADITMRGV